MTCSLRCFTGSTIRIDYECHPRYGGISFMHKFTLVQVTEMTIYQ